MIKLGTPLWKLPTEFIGSGQKNIVVSPTAGAAEQSVFAGVNMIHRASSGTIRVQDFGDVPVRVMGPVEPHDPIGKPSNADADYLVAGGSPNVGKALQRVSGNVIRLIMMRVMPSGVSDSLEEVHVQVEHDDFLVCQTELGATVYVAKPRSLRASLWKPGWSTSVGGPGFVFENGNGSHTFGYALKYWSKNARAKVVFNNVGGKVNIPDLLEGVLINLIKHQKGPPLDFTVNLEVIDPQYTYAGVAAGTDPEDGANTLHIGMVQAMRLSTPIMLTPEGIDGVPAGTPIYHLDMNVDARRWTPWSIATNSIVNAGSTEAVFRTLRQWPDQLLSESSPANLDKMFGV